MKKYNLSILFKRKITSNQNEEESLSPITMRPRNFPIGTLTLHSVILEIAVGTTFFVMFVTFLLFLLLSGRVQIYHGIPFSIFIIASLASLILAVLGYKQLKFTARFYKYLLWIGENAVEVSISYLAQKGNLETDFVIKDLQKMISMNLFPEGRIDFERRHLYLTADKI